MKYIRKFDTITEYNNSNLYYPNISLVKGIESDTLEYNISSIINSNTNLYKLWLDPDTMRLKYSSIEQGVFSLQNGHLFLTTT